MLGAGRIKRPLKKHLALYHYLHSPGLEASVGETELKNKNLTYNFFVKYIFVKVWILLGILNNVGCDNLFTDFKRYRR